MTCDHTLCRLPSSVAGASFFTVILKSVVVTLSTLCWIAPSFDAPRVASTRARQMVHRKRASL